jgi:hypothetical protein
LSLEFCSQNGLLAVYENGVNVSGGYMDPEKRNVKAIKLRGEKSDGLFLPIECLAYTGVDINELNPGDQITVLNGREICRKYIPKRAAADSAHGVSSKKKKVKVDIAPTFYEHKDTAQLAYNLGEFRCGDLIQISRKIHGTSQRTGYHKVFKGYNDTFGMKFANAFRKMFAKIWGKDYDEVHGPAIYDWDYVTGTRRTVLNDYEGGFYGSNQFREPHAKIFEGKLWKGETVYYEVAGFTHTGTPIMATCSNKKLNDKEFTKKYGDETIFSYGCSPTGEKRTYGRDEVGYFSIPVKVPQSRVFVYRMTMTNEDGQEIEYTPDFMALRCEYMGVETVPVEWTGFIPENPASATDATITAGEWVLNKAEQYYDGEEPLDPTHIREGCVVRILNRPGFAAYKHKNFNFKVLEGIVKESALEPDMEEADGLDETGNEEA